MSRLTIYTDVASRGNPGDAGIGVVIESEDGTVLSEISEYIGTKTNNFAEYTALVTGLCRALDLGATEVEVCTDSELLAHQINGFYKVKSANLQPLYNQAMTLLRSFRRFKVAHVFRDCNRRADELAKQAARKSKSPKVKRSKGQKVKRPDGHPEPSDLLTF